MIESIPSALSSLKTAKEIITTIQNIRDFDKISTATYELKDRLVEAIDSVPSTKEQLLSFQDRITNLEQENKRLKDWTLQKEKYTRQIVADGVFAYVENASVDDFENAHKLCCNCFDKTIQSTLQQEYSYRETNHYTLRCSNGCPALKFESYKKP